MKNIFFLILAFFSFQIVSAQNVANDNNLYSGSGLDVKPEFPGGVEAFYKFISTNYKTPNVSKLAGKVFVSFVIEKDGSLTDIKVIRDIGNGTGEEAIRVLKESPKWIPGEQNGKKVRVLFSIPIKIELSK